MSDVFERVYDMFTKETVVPCIDFKNKINMTL